MGQTDGWIAVLLKAPVRQGHDKHQMKKNKEKSAMSKCYVLFHSEICEYYDIHPAKQLISNQQ